MLEQVGQTSRSAAPHYSKSVEKPLTKREKLLKVALGERELARKQHRNLRESVSSKLLRDGAKHSGLRVLTHAAPTPARIVSVLATASSVAKKEAKPTGGRVRRQAHGLHVTTVTDRTPSVDKTTRNVEAAAVHPAKPELHAKHSPPVRDSKAAGCKPRPDPHEKKTKGSGGAPKREFIPWCRDDHRRH